MAAIEKLLVQIFDRKRQIIENLKHQKQLYDQHLLSKLLIQGIPPPSWLLNSDSQSSISDLNVLNKEELISGLLLPRTGPLASYPSGPCFLYDKPIITVANNSIPDDVCAVKCASSYGIVEEEHPIETAVHSSIPDEVCAVNCASRYGIVEGERPIVTAAHTSLPDEICAVNCASSNDFVEDEQPIVTAAHTSLPDEICAVNCASSNDFVEVEHDVASPCHVDDTEDTAGVVPLSDGDGLLSMSNYVPMSPEDQTDTKLSNAYNPEQSLVKIQRSRSRQKALELRNSAKASGKSRFGLENDVGISSGSKRCRYDEQLDDLRESLELAEPFESCSDIISNKEVPIGNSLNEERIVDACGDSLAQSTSSKANSVGSGVSEVEKDSNIDGGRSTRSSCCSEQPIGISSQSKTLELRSIAKASGKRRLGMESDVGISSGSKTRRYDEKESLELAEPLESCTGILSNKEVPIGNSLNEERIADACGDSLAQSMCRKENIVESGVSEMEKSSSIDGGRSTRSSCRSEQSISISSQNETLELRNSAKASGKSHLKMENDVGISSGSKRCRYDEQLDDLRESLVLAEPFESFTDIFSNKEVPIRNSLNEERIADACGDALAHSTGSKTNIVGSGVSEMEKSSSIDGDRRTRSSCCIEKHIGISSQSKTCRYDNNLDVSSGSGSLKFCAKEIDRSINLTSSKEDVLIPKVQYQEDEVSFGSMVKGFRFEPRQLSDTDVPTPSVNQSTTAEPSVYLPQDGRVETNALIDALCIARDSNNLVTSQHLVDDCTVVKSRDTKMDVGKRKYSQRVDELKFSIGSPLMEYMNVAEANQTMPELERFVIKNSDGAEISGDELVCEDIPSQSNIMDTISLPENFCNSASLSTPVSPFPPACKLYLAPGIYSSVPNGLLENIDLQRDLLPSGSALLGKSHSDFFSFHLRKPFLSPSGKGFDGITSKSGGSNKLGSSSLELTCFPILEDPESNEDVTATNSTGVERTDSAMIYTAKREPLVDIFLQNNSSLVPDQAVKKGSSESVSTDVKRTRSSTRSIGNQELLSAIKLQNTSKKSGLGQRTSRQTRSEKENKGLSVGVNSSKKHSIRMSSRSSKPKLSEKSSFRSRGQSLLEREQKANNIVSNISSFLPLVRQKQAASVVPEKRDVKVKALQAAEAAKRAAEKREIERKQKKEAMQLKRAITEQENIKEMELKKKLKEEERKKKEAENAAKKRQREEEERREKERKKRRLEEARLQHKQAEEKLQAWREETRCVAEDERACQRKDSDEKIEKPVEGSEEYDLGKQVNDPAMVENDRRQTDDNLTSLIDHKIPTGSFANGKVGSIEMAETSTPNCDKKDKTIDQTSVQQSYDISPYQCSDDEEEEEDEIPTKKFVPAWASKNSVALALSSLQHMDPDVIFPPGSFCSLEEVVLPRRLPQK